MKNQFPFYHTTQELLDEATRLTAACGGRASLRNIKKQNVSIDVVRVKAENSNPTNRVFILFGEHSRELISPESGLHMLKVLCGAVPTGEGKPTAADVLKDNEFELVLNGNPRSRVRVEDGEYCLRENPDGVDLNRNWDEKWQGSAAAFANANPGKKPFSEPETQIFKDLVTEFRPSTFLTVHSGTRGMYMPWAYDTEHLATRNQASMMQILKRLDEGHCQCPFGAAGKEVGYSCPGTCLDWVYDQLKAPFAFAFEIYTDPGEDESLKDRWEEKVLSGGASLLQEGHSLAHPHFLDLFTKHASDFVQVSEATSHQRLRSKAGSCFAQFNPDTKERYEATIQNWAVAFLEMAQQTNAELKKSNNTHF